jgi:hypothetical protein
MRDSDAAIRAALARRRMPVDPQGGAQPMPPQGIAQGEPAPQQQQPDPREMEQDPRAHMGGYR